MALWGVFWQGVAIACHCDNMAVVSAINSGHAKYPPLNCLLQCLFFFMAHFKIAISAHHIPGSANAIADAISRDKPIPSHPQVLAPVPTPLPVELKGLLLNRKLLWSSPNWRRMFSDCFVRVSPRPQTVPTLLPTAASWSSALSIPSKATLLYFATHLSNDSLKHRSIKAYMPGLCHAQIAMGFKDPFAGKPFPRLEYVLKGIKCAQAATGNQTCPRLPITLPTLSKLFKVWDSTTIPDSAMLKAACCLACCLASRAHHPLSL